MRRADRPLLPRTVHHCPRRGERQALLCHLTPPSKTEIAAERLTSPAPVRGTCPHLGPEGQRSAATFIFEGTSGGVERREKGNAPALPRKVHEGPRTEERRALLCHLPPSKTEVVADRFRHPFRGATHVPTSAPEGQRSAATFNFEGTSGGVERREKGNAPALPRKVHEGPRTEERRALLCHLPPSKTEVVADRFRHPFRGATHVPTSAPEGQRSAATFNFEGTSGGVERREKGRRHASPGKGQRLPRTGERQPFSASPPWNISVTRGQHLAAC